MQQESTYTVGDLAQAVGRIIERAFADEIWVRGEIRNLSRAASGHVYFTLVDPSDDPGAVAPAALPVTLFASDRDPINWALTRAGAGRMIDGTEVRIRGRLSHYAPRGAVQLRMTWIDTDYTLGRLAAERARILRVLEAEDLLQRNAALPFPLVPQRIGLVTSDASAAQADFLHELEISGFAFSVVFADARVQGAEAEPSLLAALARLGTSDVDLVAVVRGGGSQTDLAAFDREAVARAVATMPVPVLAGIGHEIDETLVDRVAAQRFKTPTACAAAIVGRVRGFLSRLDVVGGRIAAATCSAMGRVDRDLRASAGRVRRAAVIGVRRSERELTTAGTRLRAVAPAAVERAQRRVAGVGERIARDGHQRANTAVADLLAQQMRLVAAAPRSLAGATSRLDIAAATIEGRDPRRVLSRGWSLTRSQAGNIIRSVDDVAAGDLVTTTVADGLFESTVQALPVDETGANIEETS
jgi:exodeoxyribonuclease VII large subunit